jgi:hypothetical protein
VEAVIVSMHLPVHVHQGHSLFISNRLSRTECLIIAWSLLTIFTIVVADRLLQNLDGRLFNSIVPSPYCRDDVE